MKLFGNVLLRVLATFVASAFLGVIGAGSLGGVAPATAAFVGGILAVAKVIEKLISCVPRGWASRLTLKLTLRSSSLFS